MRSRRISLTDEDQASPASRFLPAISVMAGSLLTIWPFIASFAVMPPFGLLMLLGWRLQRPDAFPIWAALPLGFFDDLTSGQPLGSAMLLWQLCFFMIDLIDQRMVYRDFWRDWLVAGGAIAFALIVGRMFAAPIVAHFDTVLLLQVAVSILLFPVAARACTWLDGKRGTA